MRNVPLASSGMSQSITTWLSTGGWRCESSLAVLGSQRMTPFFSSESSNLQNIVRDERFSQQNRDIASEAQSRLILQLSKVCVQLKFACRWKTIYNTVWIYLPNRLARFINSLLALRMIRWFQTISNFVWLMCIPVNVNVGRKIFAVYKNYSFWE